MIHEPLVILDFETTGLSPETGDRITEIGLVRVEHGRITARLGSLVNCGVRVPMFITAYTGITQAMVDAAPRAEQVMRQALDFIGRAAVVAHSATFDQRFFRRECRALGLARYPDPFICSMQLARRLHPQLQSHSLAALAHKLALPTQGLAHRAPADAEVTAELMIRLGRDLAERHPGVALTAALLRRLMHTPVSGAMLRPEPLVA
jgi:DNA polymerase-3 subunit epsilon